MVRSTTMTKKPGMIQLLRSLVVSTLILCLYWSAGSETRIATYVLAFPMYAPVVTAPYSTSRLLPKAHFLTSPVMSSAASSSSSTSSFSKRNQAKYNKKSVGLAVISSNLVDELYHLSTVQSLPANNILPMLMTTLLSPSLAAILALFTTCTTESSQPQPYSRSSDAISSSTTEIAAVDPSYSLLEAEVFTDLAHISLDLLTVLGGPASNTNAIMTRVIVILGRVCAILADYIPDHRVLPEELVFQTIMMGVAVAGLGQSLLPWALAATHRHDRHHKNHHSRPFQSLSTRKKNGHAHQQQRTNHNELSVSRFRDGKVYATVFEPAGMTWNQFKAMRALCADWIVIEPGQEHLEDEPKPSSSSSSSISFTGNKGRAIQNPFIYFLYRGNAELWTTHGVPFPDREILRNSDSTATPFGYRSKQASADASMGQRWLMDSLIWQEWTLPSTGNRRNRNRPMFIRPWSPTTGSTVRSQTRLATAATTTSLTGGTVIASVGDKGATLLRINRSKLQILLRSDPDLEACLQHLFIASLHEKYVAAQEALEMLTAPMDGDRDRDRPFNNTILPLNGSSTNVVAANVSLSMLRP